MDIIETEEGWTLRSPSGTSGMFGVIGIDRHVFLKSNGWTREMIAEMKDAFRLR